MGVGVAVGVCRDCGAARAVERRNARVRVMMYILALRRVDRWVGMEV